MYWALMLILAGLIAILLWMVLPHHFDTRNPGNFARLFERVWTLLILGVIIVLVVRFTWNEWFCSLQAG